MFWSKNKKNRYTPAYPSFCYIKVGYKGVYNTRTCFPDGGFITMTHLHHLNVFCFLLQGYIEDIQVFGVNMSFISLSEVKKILYFMSAEGTNEI